MKLPLGSYLSLNIFFKLFFSPEEITPSATAITEAVSYVTKKADSKSRDVRILQPTIATQNVRELLSLSWCNYVSYFFCY